MDRTAIGVSVALVLASCGSGGEATCRPDGTELTITADKSIFSTDCLAAPADQAFTIAFRNDDAGSPHNVQIRDGATALFSGENASIDGGSLVYDVQPIPAGTYEFRCTIHSGMRGTFIAA